MAPKTDTKIHGRGEGYIRPFNEHNEESGYGLKLVLLAISCSLCVSNARRSGLGRESNHAFVKSGNGSDKPFVDLVPFTLKPHMFQ
jgi:hypothetical protein